MARIIQVFLLFGSLSVIFGICRADLVKVTTSGLIRGFMNTHNGVDVETYLGVPYATPPTGPLRLRNPVPHPEWDGIRNATANGPDCPDARHSVWDEDCLYANVYVPRKTPDDILPVLVYIHGGGFQHKATTADPTAFAATGNVIVVAINYRTNVFGFFSTGDYVAPGNFGLMDQRAAIVWTKENIAAFGGNPHAITIYGRSAGGESVGFQQLSPMNNGLYLRAISGSAVAITPGILTKRPQETSTYLVELLNCTADNKLDEVECLRHISAQDLLTYALQTPPASDSIYTWLPVVDGTFLTDTPEKLLRSGALENRDYLMGNVNSEGSVAGAATYRAVTSVEAFVSTARAKLFTTFSNNFENVVQATKYRYCYDIANNVSPNLPARYVDFYGEWRFVASTVLTADIYAELGHNTYFFYFTRRPSYSTRDDFIGCAHGEEKFFLFGLTRVVTDDEMELSTNMMTYFANFVRSGDPNHPDPVPVEWPRYNTSDRPYLELDVNMTSQNVKTNLLPSQMFFWNEVIPSINSAGSPPDVEEDSTTSAPLPDMTSSPEEAEDGQSGTNVAELLRSTQIVMYAMLGVSIALLLLLIILAFVYQQGLGKCIFSTCHHRL
ncbi:fatty acyl-CoA hydrolase precursor, medium chain-like [Branchiostoma floridae]|uniref:Carboxylic ester hydrolase n=2 Tax=Branchiostoma floridae TaxID=7739 RepID=A0A9J7M7A6_BRAFL|nr:fatty acyl-CoA hydrolase precursor, medium chain-like [Branchiostoma floridae]